MFVPNVIRRFFGSVVFWQRLNLSHFGTQKNSDSRLYIFGTIESEIKILQVFSSARDHITFKSSLFDVCPLVVTFFCSSIQSPRKFISDDAYLLGCGVTVGRKQIERF